MTLQKGHMTSISRLYDIKSVNICKVQSIWRFNSFVFEIELQMMFQHFHFYMFKLLTLYNW